MGIQKTIFLGLVPFLVAVLCFSIALADDKSETSGNENVSGIANDTLAADADTVAIADTLAEDEGFKFLGEARDRPENFDDYDGVVDTNNIYDLYSNYYVGKLTPNVYIVTTDRIYKDAKTFTRLIKFKNGKQRCARTFYGYHLVEYIPMSNGNALVGLNSPDVTSGYGGSSFGCKIVLLGPDFEAIKGNFYAENVMDDYLDYCFIESLYGTKDGFHAVLYTVGFDADEYYIYTIKLDRNNREVSRKKKVVKESW